MKRKVKFLVYGPKQAGKTSILERFLRKVNPEELERLPATQYIDVKDHVTDRFQCSMYDCGGQMDMMDYYNEKIPDKIFSNVHVFFFVVDARQYFEENVRMGEKGGTSKKQAIEKARKDYLSLAREELWRALKHLHEFSNTTMQFIAILANKADLPDARDHVQMKESLLIEPDDSIIEGAHKAYHESLQPWLEKMVVRSFNSSIYPRKKDGTAAPSAIEVIERILSLFEEMNVEPEKEIEHLDKIKDAMAEVNKACNAHGSYVVDLATSTVMAEVLNLDVPNNPLHPGTDVSPPAANFWKQCEGFLRDVSASAEPEMAFIIGSSTYLYVDRIMDDKVFVIVIPRNVDNLELALQSAERVAKELRATLAG